MSISSKQLAVYLSLLVMGGGVGIAGSRYVSLTSGNLRNRPTTPENLTPIAVSPSPSYEPGPIVEENRNFIAEAVDRVGTSVVRIDAARAVAVRDLEGFESPLFRRFFGDEVPQLPERLERGTGSGFILSEDGIILTNAHVVEGADEVDVRLKDGRVLKGQVIGSDSLTDVAVVRVDAVGLPTAPLGRSVSLVPGQWAIAIGNPLGLDNTVTMGIISAIDRSSAQVGIGDQQRVRFIQTDAAINPGNSGGPLLNDRGEVIGVNTAIRANAQGLGFAIPIETAQRIADQILTRGHAEHPFLGVQMLDLSPTVREQINQKEDLGFTVDRDEGTIVIGVLEDSPAAAAGFESGDIILSINGVPVNNAVAVQEQVEQSQVGQVLPVEVERQGQKKTLEVKPQMFPDRSDRSG
ncbi:MAG: HhoA/HhoB/HtrA family serine endopeptidase [Geitlerinemataceae cyanobacterium]